MVPHGIPRVRMRRPQHVDLHRAGLVLVGGLVGELIEALLHLGHLTL